MWGNISKQPRFMDKIVEHRAEIIPVIEEKIKQDQATEFEKKVLYGQLLKRK